MLCPRQLFAETVSGRNDQFVMRCWCGATRRNVPKRHEEITSDAHTHTSIFTEYEHPCGSMCILMFLVRSSPFYAIRQKHCNR
mmetsp:Transcript_19449/g.54084  ORF Transcript_19449/g.54084 Transcript_19449/m.54084 type:complete len:83 (-) Transcript_19449:30-278(-)